MDKSIKRLKKIKMDCQLKDCNKSWPINGTNAGDVSTKGKITK